MLGAALGDIAGSVYEFADGLHYVSDFEAQLKEPKTRFTDDTAMTCAIADALFSVGKNAPDAMIRLAAVTRMQKWGNAYPRAGYGGRFKMWLRSPDPKPYGSYGNGAAMRVSSVGWMYDSLERTLEVAEIVTAVTHNHPKAIDGARATAAAIYIARTGGSKEDIKAYIDENTDCFPGLSLEEVTDSEQNNIECVLAVSEALIAFLASDSITDAVSKAIHIGGDTDTLGAIAGSIAEAYYGRIGEDDPLYPLIKAKLPEEMFYILDRI